MKIKHFFIIVLILFGCKKDHEEPDYRQPFTGTFNFTTIKKHIGMCYDTSAMCINGWETRIKYSTIITSIVEPLDSNRLKIMFGDSVIGRNDVGEILSQIITPILLSDGKLSLPEYPKGAHNRFIGYYKGKDTIIMDLQFGYGIGIYAKYEIAGIRKK